MRRIQVAEHAHEPARKIGAGYFAQRWGHGEGVPDPDTVSGREIPAFISWGRWVVECPDCSSAQPALENDRRFLCCECGNMGQGWHSVAWPVNLEAIEAVLMFRPYAATRNWRPGEPLAALQADNAAHRLPTGGADPADMQRALGYRRAKD